MKRLDIVTLLDGSRKRTRNVFVTMIFFAVWVAVLFPYSSTIIDKLGEPVFWIVAAVPIVALVIVALSTIFGAPKCPNCGVRLVGSLINTAIASGNCGYCGMRVLE
jgi:hypothetical protein